MAQTEKKELLTNELVKGATRAYEGLKKGPSRGTVITLAVIITLALVIWLFWYFWTAANKKASARWLIADTALFPEQVTDPAQKEELADSNQEQILRFKTARMKLALGVRDLG